MLAGIANMLECHGFETDDRSIALGMEAPYLFMRSDDGYTAGTALLRPEWINLYLHTIGFHLDRVLLPKTDVIEFLRLHRTAMMAMRLSSDNASQPVLFTGFARARLLISTLHPRSPQSKSYTKAQFLAHLPDSCTVYTLKSLPPEAVDFLPYLGMSLQNLNAFWNDFQEILTRTVTRAEYAALQKSHLRALMHNLLPLTELTNDRMLINELKILDYFYEKEFSEHSPVHLHLYDHIPSTFVKNCVHWLMEDIVDRMYELGASDELVESFKSCSDS